ncbi:uncharacterized protein CC84DRAFT_1076353, partial [Paraphaeosphaeria sporulosa]
FAENIAVRPNNHLLITSLSTSALHTLDPYGPNTTTLLPPISNANGISGIAELQPDLFAVSAGLWNTTERRATNETIWTIDFRQAPPAFTKVVEIPETTILNGLTAIPGTSIVLASDSAIGAIYSVDVGKRSYAIAIQDPILTPVGPAPNLGVNGIEVHGSDLYFANSGRGVLGRFPINRAGRATGEAEVVAQFNASVNSAIDDFAIDEGGIAYVAFHPNTIFKVGRGGKTEVVVSGEGEVRDPTSLALGR